MYGTDLFLPLIETVKAITQCESNDNKHIRIVVEHLRSVSFLFADGVISSNE